MIEKFALIYPHTTGPELDKDEILQLGYTIFQRDEKPARSEHTFAISGKLTHAAKSRTGLTNADIQSSEAFKTSNSGIVKLLKACDRIFVLSFSNEMDWISEYLGLESNKTIDLISVAQFMLPEIESYTRSDLYHHYFKKAMPEKTLGPMLDISAKIFEAMIHKVERDQRPLYIYFHKLADLSGDPLLMDISQIILNRTEFNIIQEVDLFSGKLREPNQKEENWDGTPRSLLKPLWESEDEQQHKEFVSETNRRNEKTQFPGAGLLKEMFSVEGIFKGVDNYHPRAAQIQYATEVNDCLKDHTISFIEGGTGIGKSLGYLVPALEVLSRTPGMQIIVSTATKNLQTQLLDREIPKLAKKYGHIKVALLKGKGNYICLSALERAFKQWFQDATSKEHRLAWIYLLNFLHSRQDGILDSVPRRIQTWIPSIRSLLKETNAATHCKKGFCNIGRDFYGQALHHAATAQLIITNHYKLAVLNEDLTQRVTHYIIDEADQWERSCQNAYSDSIGSKEIRDILSRLTGGKRKGYLDIVNDNHRKKAEKKGAEISADAPKIISNSLSRVNSILIQIESWNNAFRETLPANRGRNMSHECEWLMEKVELMKGGELLKAFCSSLNSDLSILESLLKSIYGLKHLKTSLRNRALVYQLIVQRLADSIKSLEHNFGTDEVAHSLVLLKSTDFEVKKLQVKVADIIREKFYQGDNRVLYTSASLSLDGHFNHFKEIYGAQREDVHTAIIQSDLSVSERAVAYVDSSIALYDFKNLDSMEAWRVDVDRALAKYVLGVNGRSLILFTSNADMERSFRAVQGLFRKHDILPLIQNGSSEEEIDEFRRNEYSVLFGVDRFWSGVDFPGVTLSQVIIVKAPNPSLGDPIIQHRNIHEAGFMRKTYGVMSKLKLKQGVGRLIRTEQDRGGIIILDGRYIHSPWLTSQLSALPIRHQVSADQDEILRGILKKCRLEDEFKSRKLDFGRELASLKQNKPRIQKQEFAGWNRSATPRNKRRTISIPRLVETT